MPDAMGNIKGIALGGKAGEAWERIFGAGGLEEQQVRYHPTSEMGAFRAALEAEMRGAEEMMAREREKERELLNRHLVAGDGYMKVTHEPVDAAYAECECGPDDCPCCCRCG